MTKLRDIARMRDITTRSLEQEIPDVQDPEVLRDAAKLVWEKLVNDKVTPNSDTRIRNGQPGKRWQGRILLDVFYKLWPRLADRVLLTEEESHTATGAVMDYLTECGMLHCEQKTTRLNPAVWWVSDHWQPMTFSSVTEAAEASGEAEETVDGEEYPCRVCGTVYPGRDGRGGHEYSTHRVVVDTAGVIYEYDDPKYTPQYATDVVMRVLEASLMPLSFNAVAGETYVMDPRVGKPAVRQILDELVEANAVRKIPHGARVVYDLVKENMTKPPAPTEELTSTVTEAKTAQAVMGGVAPVPVDFASSVDFVRHVTKTAKGSFETMLGAIDEMARYANAKEQELHALRVKLVNQAPSGEVAKLKERVAELEKELEKTMEERDSYKHSIEAFQAAFSGMVRR